LTQLEKFTKRIKQLERELAAGEEQQRAKDKVIQDMGTHSQGTLASLEDARNEAHQYKREWEHARAELEGEQFRHRETRELLKKCEEK